MATKTTVRRMTTSDAVISALQTEIPELLEKQSLPGLAVGICDASSIIWSAGFGTTRAAGTQPITSRTMFSVQSCSKMYTATAVMLAVQRGLVDLDTPIVDYLPEFTVHGRFEKRPESTITLRHLLSHTAGFTHEAPVGSNFRIGKASFTAHCQSISDTWLRFPVGHHYEYSNLGIDLAGYVLQRVSGLPFVEFVRREVLAPLELARTTFDHHVVSAEPDRAVGHDRSLGPRVPLRIPMVAAGAVYTSAEDACRYLQLHLSGGSGLLEPSVIAEMYRIPFAAPGQIGGYGLGISIGAWDGLAVRGHSGGGFGFLCDMYVAPDHGIGVVVLTNSVNAPEALHLTGRIMRNLVGDITRESVGLPESVAVGRADIDRIAGEYVGRGNDTVELVAAGSGAVLCRSEARHTLRFVDRAEFVTESDSPERYRVLDDESGMYLLRLDDGYVRYRNDVPSGGEPQAPDGPWNRDYVVRVNGIKIDTVRLRRENDVALIDRQPGPRALRLEKHSTGRYFSSTGELLDLTKSPPTYANVRLHE